MYCPKCFSKTLVSFDVEGHDFSVEQCSKCGGLWFDGGELEQALGKTAVKSLKVPRNSEQTPLPCPHCRKKLYSFKYPGTYAKIEMCKSCSGIWLDKNEFEEISTVREHSRDTVYEEETAQGSSSKAKLIGFINRTIDSLSRMN